MSPEDILIGATGFALGVLTTLALWVPAPRERRRGHSPPPVEGWEPPERIQMPPPKVYPEGQPPRRRPPTMGCPCDAGEPEWCVAHPAKRRAP